MEKEAKRLYEVLLEMLKAIKEAIEILKKTKSRELKEAVSSYVSCYVHARGLRVLLLTLHESMKEDAELEKKLKDEEDYLDEIVKKHKLEVTYNSVKGALEFHQNWQKTKISEMAKYNRINSRFVGMLLFYGGESLFEKLPAKSDIEKNKQDYLRMILSLDRMGIKDIRYKIITCAAEVIVIIRRIVKLIKANRSQEARIDTFLKYSVLPDFRLEVALLEKAVVDRDLIEHSKRLKRHLQELEGMV